MEIIKKIAVKQMITETSKKELMEKFSAQQLQLQKEISQLQFEIKKQERQKGNRDRVILQLQKEVEARKEKMTIVQFQMEQLHMLPLGSLIKESEVEAIITVKEGDDWRQLMKETSIIIKDGIVHEIR